jgi:NADH-quinone oxidoreductase subunit M
VIALHLPWIEIAILLAVLGAVGVSRVRDPQRAARLGTAFTGMVFLCTVVAWIAFALGVTSAAEVAWGGQVYLRGREVFRMDNLSAPLVVVAALLHFLTALATPGTKRRRFSFSWSLFSEAIRLAIFSCQEPWVLIGLLAANAIPPLIELLNRRQSPRVYVLHMALFLGLLVLGWAFVDPTGNDPTHSIWATACLLAAVLIRCGCVPTHCWLTDWFEHASFGNALLFATPLTGVYLALRLVLPVAPDWALTGIGVVSLVTALYAASMAIVQQEVRRFFAYLFLSHVSLVLVGLELHTAVSLTGALCLWFAVTLSLSGFGLTLRALEARYGRLWLDDFRGLYEHSPMLAVCFLVTGLASVGFPGTLGFVSTDLLVEGTIQASLPTAIVVVMVASLNGIAVVRAYFRLFTGARHFSTVSLGITTRERFVLLTLTALILGGGLFPQPGIAYLYAVAEQVLQARDLAVTNRMSARVIEPGVVIRRLLSVQTRFGSAPVKLVLPSEPALPGRLHFQRLSGRASLRRVNSF